MRGHLTSVTLRGADIYGSNCHRALQENAVQLPTEVRESLIVLLDEYFEDVNDSPDATVLASFVVRVLESCAEEAGVDDAENIISSIEEAAEMEEPLAVLLTEEFASNDELELTGEEVVEFVIKLCSVTWDEEDELDEFDEFDDYDNDLMDDEL